MKKYLVFTIPIVAIDIERKCLLNYLSEIDNPAFDFLIYEKTVTRALKEIDKANFDFCLIIGEREMKHRKAIIRDMVFSEQKEISLDDLPDFLHSYRLKNYIEEDDNYLITEQEKGKERFG